MSSGISHRKDVEFLEDCNPPLVERNADEFKRLHDMLVAVDPSAERAEKHTQWKSEGSQHYEARLTEARKLIAQLAEGYAKASGALRSYAFALEVAKTHYSNGKANEQSLAELIHTKGTAITREAQEAEPMRQWEDMRDTTGVMDFFAELTMDVDDIRDDANRLHDAAGGDFHLAKTTEHEAREICVYELKQAYDLLPDFRMGFIQRVDVVSAIAELRREAAEASTDPLMRLPGSGPKGDYYPTAGDDIVSPTLRDIRLQIANLPGAEDSYWSPPSTAQDRADWIAANKEIIKAAARNSGLPPDMVAGIAWQEVGGQPGILDDMTDTIREQADSPLSPIAPESLPWRLGGDPDNTSMGPIAIQVRRGAEVLGYDPEHLTDQQRGTVETALQDPAQNIFIASEYLAQLKAESEFAAVPAEEMTPAQYQELAARYNGGPYWETDDAQDYGRGFANNLDEARNALR
ncbi:hypothetical protein RFN57_14895 [Streptomyces violaceochromogenes]|uniref:WXG100 family type VII secretion target n=1 Tax=Streptomyces violaceochromogenes TaxID=67377 RepID=A0ABU6LVN2_9ACTN|nr:hypothetical protein [Streptomyces violaceochromogenes]MEC7053567.1 hypothetical protein [Streptomyces violaceochromogenes]GHC59635.1 hypothetical protein GCM10010309_19960 [Streptomyces violaceochromogenes]